MNHLTDLFKLLELTRSQPQYGYALSGMRQNDMSNLAEHHYLVTFIAWQLAIHMKEAGAEIDVQKVLEFSLIHDLGELFGGDIAMPYAKANPKARELAKAFEGENQRFLSGFFGPMQDRFQALSTGIMDAKSDEAVICKLADYLEVTYFKNYMSMITDADMKLIGPKLQDMVGRLKDPIAKEKLSEFTQGWQADLLKKSIGAVLYGRTDVS